MNSARGASTTAMLSRSAPWPLAAKHPMMARLTTMVVADGRGAMMRAAMFLGLAAFTLGLAASPASAQSAFCDNPGEQCGKLLTSDCVSRIGAGSVASEAPVYCAEQFEVYRNCLDLVVQNCNGAAGRSRAGSNGGSSGETTQFADEAEWITEVVSNVDVSLRGCAKSDRAIVCNFVVFSPDEERHFRVSVNSSIVASWKSYMELPGGVTLVSQFGQVGRERDNARVEVLLPANTPTEMQLKFDASGYEDAREASLLIVTGQVMRSNFTARFKHVIFQ